MPTNEIAAPSAPPEAALPGVADATLGSLPLLDLRGTADLLGLCPATVLALVKRGELVALKVTDGPTSKLKFRPAALVAWIASRERAK